MTKEEINQAVKERLRIANERLSEKNGVDPNDPRYRKKVANICYAMAHNISCADVSKHRRGEYKEPETKIPTVKEIEKSMRRPLRTNKPDHYTCSGYGIRDVLTGEKYSSLSELVNLLGMDYKTIKRRISRKEMINNTYYEYI